MDSGISKRLKLLLLLLPLLALGGCASAPATGNSYKIFHTVAPGDTLYSLAWRYGYDFRQLAAWNHIRPPYEIYPGQRLLVVRPNRDLSVEQRLPPVMNGGMSMGEAGAHPPPAAHPAPPPRPVWHQKRRSAPAHRHHRAPPKRVIHHHHASPPPLPRGPIHWRWPAKGKVVAGFAPAAGRKGIDIHGHYGQPVYAAAPGNVVYSGNGLIGYGNLIIIKHSDSYLSAYGHNKKLLVKEGDTVRRGEEIAEMGRAGTRGSILHFEIRRDGKPVDPLRYLPK